MGDAPTSSARALYERLLAGAARRPLTVHDVRAELGRQTLFQPHPDDAGLDALAGLLAGRLTHGEVRLEDSIRELERAFAGQPLVHLYGFALRREAGDGAGARASLDALLALDPGDPMAACLDAHLRGQALAAASAQDRLANIARFANTPLLSNPYSLAVGIVFESIRGLQTARVLDVGVGSGAQMEQLLALLGRLPHRLRRLELVGLDPLGEFLTQAQERLAGAAAALIGSVDVVYEPVQGRVESLDDAAIGAITGGGLDVVNATIALHEIPGEAKLAALGNLRRAAPRRLVIAEWNYFLENVLAETSTEFVFNARQVAAGMVAALRERYPIDESRAVVRDWLTQAEGQLTCPPEQRQECFLDVASWRALLEHRGWQVPPVDPSWLTHAAEPAHARVAGEGWYVWTSDYAGATPIALLVATAA
jgi:hypothetical protein